MEKKLKKKILYELKCTGIMLFAVIVSFVSLHVFVIPAKFSPSGIDGISTILYEITNINIGWFKIFLNLPLLILAWIFLNKRYVLYISVYTILDSVGLILLEKFGFPVFISNDLPIVIPIENTAYVAKIPEEMMALMLVGKRLIAAIFAGIMLGITSGLMLKMGFSTGGTDIIASLVHKKKPFINTERIISIICYIIILCSYFVYWDITSILLSVIQIIVFEFTTSAILKGDRYAVEVKIVTKEPEKIEDIILNDFEHSATVLQAEGMYSKEQYKMVLTVMTERELVQFRDMIKEYNDTFLYYSGGVRVQGLFQFNEHNINV